MISLEGAIDLHIHTAPDVRPRRMDAIDAAREAAAAGMCAIVLKAHYGMTAGLAALVERVVPGIRVFGGVVLNEAVGGLNPVAVETALQLGARVIWMPTLSAAQHLRFLGHAGDGLRILDEARRIKPEVEEILRLVAQHDRILATGHLSVEEIVRLIPAAQAAGVRRLVITHPEHPVVGMPIRLQQELARRGAFFERCFASTLLPEHSVPMAAIISAIRQVGPETTVLATDLGQPENPSPVEGLRAYLQALHGAGFRAGEIDRMVRWNSAWLLDLA
jgi:hypothetical protein